MGPAKIEPPGRHPIGFTLSSADGRAAWTLARAREEDGGPR